MSELIYKDNYTIDANGEQSQIVQSSLDITGISDLADMSEEDIRAVIAQNSDKLAAAGLTEEQALAAASALKGGNELPDEVQAVIQPMSPKQRIQPTPTKQAESQPKRKKAFPRNKTIPALSNDNAGRIYFSLSENSAPFVRSLIIYRGRCLTSMYIFPMYSPITPIEISCIPLTKQIMHIVEAQPDMV